MRRVFRWSPERRAALEKQKRGKDVFLCELCAYEFPKDGVAVDHISPVVDVRRGFSGWDEYVQRLFCNRTGLQVLCKATCHAAKTKRENALRREVKAAKKGLK